MTDIAEQMAEMERLAKAALHGPWVYFSRTYEVRLFGENGGAAEDLTFIAAANPAAVLAVVAHTRAETARADAAESERDASRAQHVICEREACAMAETLGSRLAALECAHEADKATIARLVEALEPFAKMTRDITEAFKDQCPVTVNPYARNDGTETCVGDLRRAARAVADATGGTGGAG